MLQSILSMTPTLMIKTKKKLAETFHSSLTLSDSSPETLPRLIPGKGCCAHCFSASPSFPLSSVSLPYSPALIFQGPKETPEYLLFCLCFFVGFVRLKAIFRSPLKQVTKGGCVNVIAALDFFNLVWELKGGVMPGHQPLVRSLSLPNLDSAVSFPSVYCDVFSTVRSSRSCSFRMSFDSCNHQMPT